MKYAWSILLCLVACQPAPTELATSPAAPSAPRLANYSAKAQAPSPDSTVARFVRWYGRSVEAVHRIYFIEGGDPTGQSIYRLNPRSVKRYLDTLRGSGGVSDAYLTYWRRHIERWGDSLRVHPQNDGPPMGFDFDYVTLSQEPEEYLASYAKATRQLRYLAPDRAMLTARYTTGVLSGDERRFYLRRYSAGWLIDSISIKK